MREFIHHLTELNFQRRTIGFIENGSWAPMATKVMRGMLEKSKDIAYTEAGVRILSALNEESIAQLQALAAELCQ
jgi:flavorubredoxin